MTSPFPPGVFPDWSADRHISFVNSCIRLIRDSVLYSKQGLRDFRDMSSKKTASKHAISVSVRIKPSLLTKEDCSSSVKVEERSGRCGVTVGNSWFSYPANVICGSDQSDAYNALVVSTGLLESLREWYSCTILAYGQTGSGKTFTMVPDIRSVVTCSDCV